MYIIQKYYKKKVLNKYLNTRTNVMRVHVTFRVLPTSRCWWFLFLQQRVSDLTMDYINWTVFDLRIRI